jgi:hypothetical protein
LMSVKAMMHSLRSGHIDRGGYDAWHDRMSKVIMTPGDRSDRSSPERVYTNGHDRTRRLPNG